MKKHAVLFLNRKGGGSHFTYELVKEIEKNRLEQLGMVIIPKTNIQKHLYDKLSTDVTYLPHYDSLLSYVFFVLLKLPFIGLWLVYQLKKNSIDVLTCTMPSAYFPLTAWLLKLVGIEYRLIVHDVHQHVGEESKIQKFLYKLDMNFADSFFVLTQHAKEQLSKLTKKPIKVLKHGYLTFGREFAAGEVKPEKQINAVYIGRIKEYKGVHYFLEANQKFAHDDRIKFTCAGSGDLSFLGDLNKYSNTEIINDWLSDEDIVDLVMSSSIIVLPYIDASQSGVIPLAVFHGKPVIVTDAGGLAEQVNGDFAITVSPRSVSQLVEAYEALLNGSIDLNAMSIKAREFALSELSWKNVIAQLID
ncbi:glycosyltransferase family 4 protein [Pseudoalteromonas rubra]|uniref:Glycosyl transferase family 1 domain-containing protein n=1 Tax=Pseudoalteromonas rubra TaxID=43658 RepID=A0A0F4QGM4_9GAMM|nr:glycosyltransferase [Pseudoalteromonas rubra]KJZ05827.1 hypothetical protein TW77_21490 [Pseudoalteromonas rubra]